MRYLPDLPRGNGSHNDAPLATSQWLPSADIIRALAYRPGERAVHPIILGELWDERGRHRIEIDDNRHLVTIAGSRAGKGVSLIMPNLLNYPGSVVCVDPKGENAAVTAKWRAEELGQEIIVLDPYGVAKGVDKYKRTFNPLQWIDPADREAIDDIAGLADALVMRGNSKDPHWDESARAFLKGVMLFILSWVNESEDDDRPDNEKTKIEHRSLPLLWQLALQGLRDDDGVNSLPELLRCMRDTETFGGAVSAVATTILNMADEERGSVMSTVARHIEFLESPLIQDVMTGSSLDPSHLKSKRMTIYLVLPEWRLGTHSRWLRLIINSLLVTLQRTTAPNKDEPAVLFILDEMATLGHLESIERAAGYIAGFGVKLWSILQDLGQLKDLYKGRWETFLGNAGVVTAFGNTDTTTLDYISKRLGETEISRLIETHSEQSTEADSRPGIGRILDTLSGRQGSVGGLFNQGKSNSVGQTRSAAPQLHRTPLLTPDEVGRYISREKETLLAMIGGLNPVLLNRIIYINDPVFKDRAAPNPYHG